MKNTIITACCLLAITAAILSRSASQREIKTLKRELAWAREFHEQQRKWWLETVSDGALVIERSSFIGGELMNCEMARFVHESGFKHVLLSECLMFWQDPNEPNYSSLGTGLNVWWQP